MAYQRYFAVCAALVLLYSTLPPNRALRADFQEMLYPLQLVSQGAASPEDAAMSHFRACATQSPQLFSQNLLLGVCDGPIGTINKYAECLHVTTFDNGEAAFTVFELPFRLLQEEAIRAVATQAFDTEDEDVAALLMFAEVTSYYGQEFMCVDVVADDADGVEYRNRIVVGRVGDRWYAMPRGGSSSGFYQIADAMPSTIALTAVAPTAGSEPVVLTLDTMAEHGFFIECRSFEVSESTLAQGRWAETGVLVRFDPMRGPAIDEFLHDLAAPATLVVRDGDDVVLSVPVSITSWTGNDGGFAIDFTLQQGLIEETELFLENTTGSFAVDISSFL